MNRAMGDHDSESQQIRRAARAIAWPGALLTPPRRLRRMVALRIDRRLKGRLDPSDVIQEAFLDATAGLANYAAGRRCRSSSGSAG